MAPTLASPTASEILTAAAEAATDANKDAPTTVEKAKEPVVAREADRPTVDKGRLLVFIVTPLRTFPSEEVWETLTVEQRVRHMPKAVRLALHELATRGTSHDGMASTDVGSDEYKADQAFREQANKYTFEWGVAVGGLCRARNGAVAEFNEAKGHFLIWWDSDLEPDGMTPAEAILRLLSHRVPIVGGLYCKRAKRPTWAATFMPVAEMQKSPDRKDLLQMAELAGGFKCYMWRTYSELARLFPKLKYRDRDTGKAMMAFYQQPNLEGDLLSEDYWMDWLCRCAAGGEPKFAIWADTKLKLRHVEVDEKGERHLYPPGMFPPIQAVDAREGT